MADFRLTPEQARLAVAEALESGRFVQARSALRTTDGPVTDGPVTGPLFRHCCLGVGCQVFHEVEGLGQWSDEHQFSTKPGVFDDRYNADGQAGVASSVSLPALVREWLGFATDCGHFRTGEELPSPDAGKYGGAPFTALMGMNDSAVPFQEIAKVIREGRVAEEGQPSLMNDEAI